MNFIAASIELQSFHSDTVPLYGLSYCAADAIVPDFSRDSELRVRLLCYEGAGHKLNIFKSINPGSRSIITGDIYFSENRSSPLDIVIATIEPNVPQEMYLNQAILGNAFFKNTDIKERRNGVSATTIGTTLDDSDVTTWLCFEAPPSRKEKLQERIRAGRDICVQGRIREYRKEDSDSPYRAIVVSDFSTRQESSVPKRNATPSTTAAGYDEVDPTPVIPKKSPSPF